MNEDFTTRETRMQFDMNSSNRHVNRGSPMRLALPAQGKIAMGPAGDLAKGESDIFVTTPLLWYPQFKCKTLSKTNWQRRLSGQPAHARGQSSSAKIGTAIRNPNSESEKSLKL
jgi:hypothetical protein